jgi:hypothetical protein
VHAVVNCRVCICELEIALELLVVKFYKWSINPITNPNPVYSHSYTCQYYKIDVAGILSTFGDVNKFVLENWL